MFLIRHLLLYLYAQLGLSLELLWKVDQDSELQEYRHEHFRRFTKS